MAEEGVNVVNVEEVPADTPATEKAAPTPSGGGGVAGMMKWLVIGARSTEVLCCIIAFRYDTDHDDFCMASLDPRSCPAHISHFPKSDHKQWNTFASVQPSFQSHGEHECIPGFFRPFLRPGCSHPWLHLLFDTPHCHCRWPVQSECLSSAAAVRLGCSHR